MAQDAPTENYATQKFRKWIKAVQLPIVDRFEVDMNIRSWELYDKQIDKVEGELVKRSEESEVKMADVYRLKTVCHVAGEYARDEDGDGFHEVHVNTMEGVWSLLRSWLRPHRGVSQERLPIYVRFFPVCTQCPPTRKSTTTGSDTGIAMRQSENGVEPCLK